MVSRQLIIYLKDKRKCYGMSRSYNSLAYRGRFANPGILRGRRRPASSPDHIKNTFSEKKYINISRPPPSTPLPAASPVGATAPSNRDAIASAHPADDSPATGLDSSMALFSRHYDAAAGDVLTLAPSSPPRRLRPPSPSLDDDQKRLRSPADRAPHAIGPPEKAGNSNGSGVISTLRGSGHHFSRGFGCCCRTAPRRRSHAVASIVFCGRRLLHAVDGRKKALGRRHDRVRPSRRTLHRR